MTRSLLLLLLFSFSIGSWQSLKSNNDPITAFIKTPMKRDPRFIGLVALAIKSGLCGLWIIKKGIMSMMNVAQEITPETKKFKVQTIKYLHGIGMTMIGVLFVASGGLLVAAAPSILKFFDGNPVPKS